MPIPETLNNCILTFLYFNNNSFDKLQDVIHFVISISNSFHISYLNDSIQSVNN